MGDKKRKKVIDQGGHKEDKKKTRKLFIILGLCLFLAFISAITLYALYFKGIYAVVRMEAGTGIPDAMEYAKSNKIEVSYYTDMDTLPENPLGKYRITLLVNGKKRIVWLEYMDTIAPTGESVTLTISALEELTPSMFVENMKDAGLVKVYFKDKPNFGVEGNYAVTVVLEDTSGNKSEVTSFLTILKVFSEVYCEAGDELPKISDFLYDKQDTGSFITDINSISNADLGEHEIKILSLGNEYTSKLVIRDTKPPVVTTQNVHIMPGQSVKAEDFIESIEDASKTKVTFEKELDLTKYTEQTAYLLIQDAAGNLTKTTASFTVSRLKGNLKVEARNEQITLEELLIDPSDLPHASFSSEAFIPSSVGRFTIAVKIDEVNYETVIEVVDTIAPKADVINRSMFLGDELTPDLFVTNIIDMTEVTTTFAEIPNNKLEGSQEVKIHLTDEGGNVSSVVSLVTLVADTEPPVIHGVVDRSCYVDNSISYLSGVYATDNRDKDITVNVDKSNVNLKKVGIYPVYYSATDATGNTTTTSAQITVRELIVTEKMLEDLSNQVFRNIINDNMSIGEKALAIYEYTNKHIAYTGYSDKSNWKKEAYMGITKGVGDCYTYFAVAKLLLEKIGAQLMDVQRVGGETRHYWLLCNLGTGWYHFDACVHKPAFNTFMVRDSDLAEYTKRRPFYFNFDFDAFPKTPTKPYDINEIPVEPTLDEEEEVEVPIDTIDQTEDPDETPEQIEKPVETGDQTEDPDESEETTEPVD